MNDMSPFAKLAPSLIPENAPFSDEQRQWLNGFFSGFIALEQAAALAVAGVPQPVAFAPEAAADDLDDVPWHDQTIPLPDRMTMAEGRALPARMMAAMAQQDCGQCGYNCKDYANAIVSKAEARLNLCVPGGKDTARMVKTLYAKLDGVANGAVQDANGAATTINLPAVIAPRGQSRDNPAEVALTERRRLNKPGSEKETWHVEFALSMAGIDYTVGDSFGIFPENDPTLVSQVLAVIGADPTETRDGKTIADIFRTEVALGLAPDNLFQLISYLTGGERRAKAKALAAGDDPDKDAATLDVLAALQKFRGVRPDPEALIEALDPLQPRLYSISSSPKAAPGKLSLTVDAVRYTQNKRQRLGCASTFLSERAPPGASLRAYVQKAHNFALPANPATPIIMVGPGTGIAPFRAFLQERAAIKAPGKNWLFFGHQRSACDFFYEDELNALKSQGVLTRLSLAWSRDDTQKFYVQDRMREVGRELWAWLQDGAHFYICGDAQRMAKDVERALIDIASTHGGHSADTAVGIIGELKKAGRYQADVY